MDWMMPDKDQKPNLLSYLSVGTEFILTFGAVLTAGLLLDRWRHSRFPWLTLLGAGCGFAIALYRLIRQSLRQGGKSQQGQRRDDDGKGP